MRSRASLWTVAILLLAAVCGAIWGTALRREGLLRLTVLDVGQGDSALIETPSGHRLLVDCARSDADSDPARSAVLPYLKSIGANRLDALVITHWDSDHAGGVPALLSSLPSRRVVAPAPPYAQLDATPTERKAAQALKRSETPLVRLRRGSLIKPGDGAVLEVLHPPAESTQEQSSIDNNASLVLRVSYGRTRFLLMGDAEVPAETSMLLHGLDLRADVLKVGHHGSRFATSDPFLRAVRPRIALISVGRSNTFGHPSPAVVARLTAAGAKVYRTDRSGALTVETDGARIALHTHRRQDE